MSKPHSDHSGCCSSSQHEHDHGHGHDHGHSYGTGEFNLKKEVAPLVVTIILFTSGLIFKEQLHALPYSFGEYLFFIPAYLISGWSVLSSAGRNILRGKVFDENFLMTIATIGAFAIHQLPEAVAVMLFYQVGEIFQDLAVSRSRQSITSLLEVRPDYANLKVNDTVKQVSPEEVEIGNIILAKVGEKIPIDGEVIEGSSQLDTSALTGEPVPRTAKWGDTVLAGMINQTGSLTVRVTKPFRESSISKILELVENASSKKAQTEKFITQFASYYTPIVVAISLAVAILPPLLIPGATSSEWVYRALVLLVISCPCGLVISIPLGYFGGVGGASRRGILVKGSTYIDALNAVKTVVFDKTGTLTLGEFKVRQIVPKKGFTQEKLLQIAATAESQSNHPVARSIQAAYGKEIDTSLVSDYQEIAGHGISAQVNGQTVLAGNDRLLHRENIEHDLCETEGTAVHLVVDNRHAGYIVVADALKEDSAAAIKSLQELGIERTIMLTGDNQAAADRMSRQLGLDSYRADLLPEDKVEAIKQLIRKAGKQDKVAYVGDGINDSPVIARADVGVAMGGLGSDAAIETADVVIITDAPSKVAEAIQTAKNTRRIVWQNITFALAVKGVFVFLAVVGIASIWQAVFADMGVALIAILNATRALNVPGNKRAFESSQATPAQAR
ncbi:MAG: cadmium-translocating P-type ATPase [Cyanobacteria bacterium QH_8_48_120]|jgi:Cd2+/Zn2+-exporting ATPase|nr:MAG: cadmium-translocating P-type ATPase [Cyanobacteria bacterium QH_1_48_107]PSO53594.1 MAG: cadmium-translocating P-type ATPase [Cyanobacteria bacterium QH_10_48_56]PSO57297.1 MAG: cadmium-translocating P-type ATPase [Cyanobacteria bacterium QH_7_48_89]PSO64379.1 MAG: cadmium-translocating P-type ATPase [Cyanobacteria bacterium QH_6_48_35]PSO70521.1 MAG: cadmium-translocating P-type ATPase [Cyanobacteria bacterium QH_8_48_120]PSO71723.1 MAG: cadmium-translocating P-type ATPase [Cyanobacte